MTRRLGPRHAGLQQFGQRVVDAPGRRGGGKAVDTTQVTTLVLGFTGFDGPAAAIESCGLPSDVARVVAAGDLPGLEQLDLWLGIDDGDTDVADVFDLAPILSGEQLPALRSLGLENSAIQDEMADLLATAPVVARLRSLSLALGTLTDRGAEGLLTGQPLTTWSAWTCITTTCPSA